MTSPPTPGACIFCRIVAGELPARRALEDEDCIVLDDVHPQAPVHLLVVPRRHTPSVVDAAEGGDGARLLGGMLRLAIEAARKEGLDATGFRLVVNHGADAGQSVDHLHLHLLGGRALDWPPG